MGAMFECDDCDDEVDAMLCGGCYDRRLATRVREWTERAVALGQVTREDAKVLEQCAEDLEKA